MDGSGLGVLAVGLVLCFLGIRSLHLAVAASGFALGWLIAEGLGSGPGVAAVVGLATALGAWVVVMLVLRAALFFVGAITGGVVGAKLFGLLEHGEGSVLLAILFVVAVGFIAGLTAQRFRSAVLAVACALGGAGLALSGLARLFPGTLGLLRVPNSAAEAVISTAVWLALAGSGWAFQRRRTRERRPAA
ncbi:hypothetical protein [Pseudonocardia acaciae]|uniref:hypothetical protein n=1 Tax=Pseudonocardia acaciae TaxID=551276 RepID=UPI00056465E4|nr:hypothetical protein [Pseudonocardia acaciae]